MERHSIETASDTHVQGRDTSNTAKLNCHSTLGDGHMRVSNGLVLNLSRACVLDAPKRHYLSASLSGKQWRFASFAFHLEKELTRNKSL